SMNSPVLWWQRKPRGPRQGWEQPRRNNSAGRSDTHRTRDAGLRGYLEKENCMKALLVYPEFPDTYWGFRHALSLQGKRAAFPPLGLLTIAALLPPGPR